jgi:hypothetical protein
LSSTRHKNKKNPRVGCESPWKVPAFWEDFVILSSGESSQFFLRYLKKSAEWLDEPLWEIQSIPESGK